MPRLFSNALRDIAILTTTRVQDRRRPEAADEAAPDIPVFGIRALATELAESGRGLNPRVPTFPKMVVY